MCLTVIVGTISSEAVFFKTLITMMIELGNGMVFHARQIRHYVPRLYSSLFSKSDFFITKNLLLPYFRFDSLQKCIKLKGIETTNSIFIHKK